MPLQPPLFHEGQRIRLRADNPALGLARDAEGIVWAIYKTTPPSYEVTLQDADGEDFDATLNEDELRAASMGSPVFAKTAWLARHECSTERIAHMSVTELLPQLESLSRREKYEVVQHLMSTLAQEEKELEIPSGSYPVWSPYGSYGAARAMEELMEADDARQ